MDERQGGRWGRLGVGAAFLTALVGTGIAGCDRLPASAVRQIRQGHDAYQQGRYAQAQHVLTPVILAHADQPDAAEAYYVRGLARLKSGQAKAGRDDLQAGVRLADRPDLRALLHAQLGNLDFEAERYQPAARQFQRAEPDLPDHPPTDRILLRHGISLQRAGQFRQARLVLADMLMRFPNGPAAAEARRRLTGVSDHYSIQCGVYSKQSSAEAVAAKLRARGVQASAWRETRNGSSRYVVRAGRFSRYADAQRALPGVRREVSDAFIVP